MTAVVELVVAALLVIGAAFALIGSWGLLRLDTFLKRLHGPSKATTLGVGCVLLASALWFAWQGQGSWHEALIVAFLFLTAPVSAHVLVKAVLALDPRLRPPEPPAAPAPSAASASSADPGARVVEADR